LLRPTIWANTLKLILVIAVGGAVGAVARHLVNVQAAALMGFGFPWGTLTVNILGSFLMGVLVETSALVWSPDPALRAMLAVGVLGAFTTFSTFSLDAIVLYERGQLALAAGYIVASVVLSIGGLFAGLAVIRTVVQ
jgi:fluoride exporter